VDDWHIGVRHNGSDALDALARVLPGALIDDPQVPDNYSLALSPRAGKGARALHLLVSGSRQLVRSRSAARVVRGLLTRLTFDLFPIDDGLVSVHMTALVRDGDTVMVPRRIMLERDRTQSRLDRAGYQIVDCPFALVDPVTRELVVPEPRLAYDRDALAALDRDDDAGRERPAVLPGRYPITAWRFGATEEAVGPMSQARAVAALLPHVERPDDEVAGLVSTLAHLVDGVTARTVRAGPVQDLLSDLSPTMEPPPRFLRRD